MLLLSRYTLLISWLSGPSSSSVYTTQPAAAFRVTPSMHITVSALSSVHRPSSFFHADQTLQPGQHTVLKLLGIARDFMYHKGSTQGLLSNIGYKARSQEFQGATARDAATTKGYDKGPTKVAWAGWGLTLSFLNREPGRCCRM